MDEKDLPNPSRRRLLGALSLALGGSGAARLLGGGTGLATAMAWAEQDPGSPHEARVFDRRQRATLRAICDHVIPETDTPGAVSLGVHDFVDHQMDGAYGAQERQAARAVLNAIDARALAVSDRPFSELAADGQRTLLEAVEGERDGFGPGEKWPFKQLKDLIVFGYCTTETGATRLLAYDPMPGGYTGSLPYVSVGRAWFS